MAILFRRSNGIYYHITFDKGHRVWRSTGKRRRVDAQKYLHDLAFDAEEQKADRRAVEERNAVASPSLTFSGFVAQWRTYALTNFAPSTVRLYNEAMWAPSQETKERNS